LQCYLPDVEATMRAGAAIAAALRAGMLVTLAGELGAGKTTLVRGMLRALGWTGVVKSPSFALVEHYQIASIYFYHFDLYRFNDPTEWDAAGFAEYFRPDAICVIEWPERAAGRLPPPDIAALLAHAPPGRTLALQAHTPAGRTCLAACSTAVR
jgi:tRNA threonylcarbamoyladenosine biosynthesis protein TsaE